jgi:AbrB family looped-hinge helix DNA binding protein
MLNKYHSKVTTKGQITIPTTVRQNLNIPSGSRVELIQQDNYVIVVPINNSLSKLKKSLPKPIKTLSCEEMNNIISNRGIQ